MSLRADFDLAVKDIFDAFDDVPVDCKYIERTFTYIPGGVNTPVEVEYNIRIIYLETTKDTLALYSDVDSEIYTFMIRTSELPINADQKDHFDIDNERYTILSFTQDPASASTEFIVRKA